MDPLSDSRHRAEKNGPVERPRVAPPCAVTFVSDGDLLNVGEPFKVGIVGGTPCH